MLLVVLKSTNTYLVSDLGSPFNPNNKIITYYAFNKNKGQSISGFKSSTSFHHMKCLLTILSKIMEAHYCGLTGYRIFQHMLLERCRTFTGNSTGNKDIEKREFIIQSITFGSPYGILKCASS